MRSALAHYLFVLPCCLYFYSIMYNIIHVHTFREGFPERSSASFVCSLVTVISIFPFHHNPGYVGIYDYLLTMIKTITYIFRERN